MVLGFLLLWGSQLRVDMTILKAPPSTVGLPVVLLQSKSGATSRWTAAIASQHVAWDDMAPGELSLPIQIVHCFAFMHALPSAGFCRVLVYDISRVV